MNIMTNSNNYAKLHGTTFVIVRQILLLFVTFCLLSGPVGAAPLLKIAWLSGTETTSGANINQGAAVALKWIGSSFDDAYFDHSLVISPERLLIKNAGDYLVAVTVPMSGSVSMAAVQTEVRVNGTPVEGAIGESSYIRNGTGHNESSDHIAVLLTNLAVDDYIEVYVKRTAWSGTINISGQASLYVENIAPERIVFSATTTKTTNSTNFNQTTAYPLEWTGSRKDTGFTHSDSTNSENIILDESGDYLVFVNLPLSGFATRGNVRLVIQDDGITVAGGEGKQGYIRNASGHNDSSIHWSGLISNVEAGSVITIQTEREGAAGNITVPIGKKGSLYLEKFDASKNIYSGRGNGLTGGTNWNPTAAQSIEWITDDIIDSTFFTHATDTNPHQITVKTAGDYLLVYNDSLTSTRFRSNPKMTVAVNGTGLPGAETKSHYIRAASGHNESSGSLVYLLRDLAVDDVITISAVREAATSTVNDNQDGMLLIWFKGDALAPVLVSAEVNHKSLVLNYTEINGLDTASKPATTDFSIDTDGATQTVTQVVVDTNTVTLSLSPGVANADIVTVNYTAGSDPIQDVAANAAANLVDQVVSNNTAKLIFITQPVSGSVDSILNPQPVVEIQDGGGIPITTDPNDSVTETVSLAFTVGTNEEGAVLNGTSTRSIDWSTGRATFSDLTIDLIGSYQLNASTNTVPSTVDSSIFSVTAGAPAQLIYSVEPTSVESTTSISPAIQVQDAFGNLVTTATDSVILTINDNPGGGSLWGTLTIAAVSGVATFSDISIDKAGSGYTLDATSTGLTTATSAGFNITVGPATQLVYSVEPTNATSTTSIAPSIQVQALDDGGNLVPTMTAPVTLAINSNPSNGILSGTVTVSAVGGEATFSDITIDKAGNAYTLDATSPALSAATSASFDITMGSATRLAYSVEPTNAVSTASIAPAIKVQILDDGGNQVSTATNQLTLAINDNPGNGTLSGTLTVSAVAGEATFSDVSIDKRGTGYRLVVGASGMTSDVSEEFNIVASDEAIQLAFSVQPTDSVSLATLVPALKVQVLDAGGNLVETAQDPIELGIISNPGGGTLAGTLTVIAVGGEATFNDLSIDRAASGYSLVASASGLTSVISSDFEIKVGNATQLVFSAEPTDAEVASPIAPAIKVQLRDSGGNLITTASDLVTLGIGTNPGQTTLLGTTSVAAVGGEATFNDVSVDQLGNGYTLFAHGPGLISATSTAFNITTGEPAKLVFSVEPSNGIAASPLSAEIKVQVQDAGGNLATTATTAITLALNDNASSATLAGTLTVNAVGREASFIDITLDEAGVGYTIQASAPGLTSSTSAAFNITAIEQLAGGGSLTAILPTRALSIESIVVASADAGGEEPPDVEQIKESDNIITSRVERPLTQGDLFTERALQGISQKAAVREDNRSGLLNRERVVAGSSVTIRYRSTPGLAPEIDVYDAQHARMVTAAPMKEVGNTGVYEYQLILDPEWESGDLSIIASESTKGTLDWMTMTVAATNGADVHLVDTKDGISVPALLSAVQAKLDSLESNLNEAQGVSNGNPSAPTERPTKDPDSPEIKRIHQSIREISELLKPVSQGNGVNLDTMHESINEHSSDINELQEKAKRLKILLDLNRELTEKIEKESRRPVTKTWYETGSVILRILVVNPSKTETQKVPVKVYLPKEISPKDILDLEDLKLDYDSEKGSYYAHNEVELGPGQSITKMVRMEDIWVFPEEELSAYLSQANEMESELRKTPYAEEGAAFLLAIDSKVQEILETQKKTVSNPAEHIQAYRQATSLVSSIKNDLSALWQYQQRALEFHDKTNIPLAEDAPSPVEITDNNFPQEQVSEKVTEKDDWE